MKNSSSDPATAPTTAATSTADGNINDDGKTSSPPPSSNNQGAAGVEDKSQIRSAAGRSYDVERKYGKIPAEIYLLYVRASGCTIVLIFFITALIWQALRVYTDVWLQQWTDNNQNTNTNTNNPPQYHNVHHSVVVAGMVQHAPITSVNISAMQQMGVHNYAGTRTTTTTNPGQQQWPEKDGGTLPLELPMHHEVTYYFHIYAIISCVCIVMAMISTPAGQWAGCKARRNLHDKLLQSIMLKSLHFFQVTPLGRIMNRFSNDMAIIDKVTGMIWERRKVRGHGIDCMNA